MTTAANDKPAKAKRGGAIGHVASGAATATGGTHTASASATGHVLAGRATATGETVTVSASPVHPTWRDWLGTDAPDPPIDDLLTRSVLLDQLHASGVDISERELRYFEAEGAIPRPIRRWRGGVQAFYPTWFLTLVPAARALRRHGLPFDEIAMTLHRHFTERTGEFSPPKLIRTSEMAIHTSAHGVDIDDNEALTTWSSTEDAISDAWQEMADTVEPSLMRLAEQHRQAANVTPGSIEIVLRNQDGRALATYKRYIGDDDMTPVLPQFDIPTDKTV